MLRTQGPDEDTRYWPIRVVILCAKVPNTIDDHGTAVRVQLSCGHVSILTGEHVQLDKLPCRVCGLKLPVGRRTRDRM